jgi:hypothetical protein
MAGSPLDRVRQVALALPVTTEEPHFHLTSFRVKGKIFATAPLDADQLNVFVAEEDIRSLVAQDPAAFEELWWGKSLSGVRVNLLVADHQEVDELLAEAWRRKAPKRAVAAYDDKPD